MKKKNEKSNKKINSNNDSTKFCNYNQFIKALKDISSSSLELRNLYELLEASDSTKNIKENKIDSYVKDYKKSVDEAINNLPFSDWDLIYKQLYENEKKNYNVNIKFILNEYSRRLKEKLLSNVNKDVKENKKNTKSEEKVSNKKFERFKNDNGMSIIKFIDINFDTNLLNNFFKGFDNIVLTDNISSYIEETNKLIEQVIFYSYFKDIKKVINSVKNNFNLEFSPIKEDDDILNEIISDELRFYQQTKLINIMDNIDKTYLITSKRISKNFENVEEENMKMTFEAIYTSTIPHYAFTQNAFNNSFEIILKDENQINQDYINKHLLGSTFLSNPASVSLVKDKKNEYIIYSTSSEKFKLL